LTLRYLNAGHRWFGDDPVIPHARLAWDIFAVVEGECGILLESGKKLPIRSSFLWIFPPQFVHGIYGIPGRCCRIVCIQTSSVPLQIEEIVQQQSFFKKSLTAQECGQLQIIQQSLAGDYQQPTALSSIRFERGIMDISLLALSHLENIALETARQKTEAKVSDAIAWFRQHIRSSPSMEDVARAVHVSPAHLRRLFMQVRNSSPSEVLAAVKLEAACYILSSSDLKLEAVTLECGFKSATDFSRVFKTRIGCTPKEWRQTLSPEEASRKVTEALAKGKRVVI
jgi:AraC family transcriptional regulator